MIVSTRHLNLEVHHLFSLVLKLALQILQLLLVLPRLGTLFLHALPQSMLLYAQLNARTDELLKVLPHIVGQACARWSIFDKLHLDAVSESDRPRWLR